MMGAATGPQSVATFLLGLNFPTSFFFFFFFFQNIAKTRVSRPWWPLDGGSKNWRINSLEGIDNEEAAADWFKTDESGCLI